MLQHASIPKGSSTDVSANSLLLLKLTIDLVQLSLISCVVVKNIPGVRNFTVVDNHPLRSCKLLYYNFRLGNVIYFIRFAGMIFINLDQFGVLDKSVS